MMESRAAPVTLPCTLLRNSWYDPKAFSSSSVSPLNPTSCFALAPDDVAKAYVTVDWFGIFPHCVVVKLLEPSTGIPLS